MHVKSKNQRSGLIQFGHADFKYVGEIWPSRQNFAQIKLYIYLSFSISFRYFLFDRPTLGKSK